MDDCLDQLCRIYKKLYLANKKLEAVGSLVVVRCVCVQNRLVKNRWIRPTHYIAESWELANNKKLLDYYVLCLELFW
jgi:hypothetical protein